ncbi:sensory transduction protein regX3 [Clostridium homopropionicum DSM 5847]|uniref:Stage 0 sporulation protein A homolog n=2 Tax=Clostridium TaxID=1485 RepID=A0A0L6ZC62_9CLOT|nr:sensory transduction protein regX3 [Clostridium homopropionicum DSM 5847]SFG74730.1 DNA-binding response regulator, OmpR family, contains REC and winged-helix (wHTH) domain [Clostridium homopropionicum]
MHMKNILIIEDEEKVSGVLKAYLEKEGYTVHCTTKGLEGIQLFKKIEFKLVILDLMLPDLSGEEVCKIIRETSDVHIFMLTAKGTLTDRIDGLNIGADEYLVKPFSPRELTARVNALFRRLITASDSSILSFDNNMLIIDYEKRMVKLNNKEITFTPNEFDILYALAVNKGIVLTREQLIDKVFGVDFEGFDRTIDVHIKNIRKKLEEDTRKPRYIITVMRVGYKFGGEN